MTVLLKNNLPQKRSLISASTSVAIFWTQVIVTTLLLSATLIIQTHGFNPPNAEGRKLFGGYRITPKQCRATKILANEDPRAKGPTICMFNHECAQRNGEVVGACMDGFLFGACCQVPKNQLPENTLINHAQNLYFNYHHNHKFQQQETETNKIVSQAYETFAENSAQQQSTASSHAPDSNYGGALSNHYNTDHIDNHKQGMSEEAKPAGSTAGSTVATTPQTNFITQANADAQTDASHEPPKIIIYKDSVRISSPSESPYPDDFVQSTLNTLSPAEDNKVVIFTTEIPTKIASSLNEASSSESNSFEEEPMATTKKTVIKTPESTEQTEIAHNDYNIQLSQEQPSTSEQHQYTGSNEDQPQDEHQTEAIQHNTAEIFGDISFTHSDITHPGADADLIEEEDLQFSTGYGPQPVFLPAPSNSDETYDQQSNKLTSNVLDATTSSSSITTHSESIETIIQQLNNKDSNKGPSYNIINHHEQQQQHMDPPFDNKPEVVSNRPASYGIEEDTKYTSLPSISYNEIGQSNEQNAANSYGQTSSTISLAASSPSSPSPSPSPSATQSTISNGAYGDDTVLQVHTLPEINYNDLQASNNPTSNYNKMPAIGEAYPIDMSYMEEEGNWETDQHNNENQQNSQNSYTTEQHQHINHSPQNIIKQEEEEQQNNQNTYTINAQQQNVHLPHLNTYSTQSDEGTSSQPQAVQNYGGVTHQRPIASYVGMITSQNYNLHPLPSEVVISSHTTKVEGNIEVSTEYKPIITTNQIIATSHKTTAKPIRQTASSNLYTNRPTLVTKKPNTQNPTKFSSQRPSTKPYITTNSIITQQNYQTSGLDTKTPLPPKPLNSKPTASYNQGIHQDYIISSGSTTKPISTRKPTKKQDAAKPASTSYITGPTTPRPVVTPQFQYNQEVPVIQADDKLDSFVLSTAESLASASHQENLSYDPPLFISGSSQVQGQRPQYNIHNKPAFVKVQPTQRPPAPTVLITPKPTSLQTTASSFNTAHHTTALSGYDSTSFVYNSLVTKKPNFAENTAADHMSISTVNSNDFDDPGYYASLDQSRPSGPLYVSGSTEGNYPVPIDDKPAFPGYYGPTPTYPAFHVPGEKFGSSIEEQVYTSPNDFINFPPVRNPNLNMSAASSSVTSDLDLSTPAFVEDTILKNKMNTLVHKIVESLQGNFEALADMIDENNNNTEPLQIYQDSIAANKRTTRKPVTKVSSKRPTTTRKPEVITTKRPVIRRTTTSTKRPATRRTTRKPTTTSKAPIEDDIVDEEDEEDANISENEITEEETYGGGGSGRKIQCGMRPHVKSGRIVGGKGATFGAYPWQVLVRESTWLGLFTKNKCGGVLITSRYVITAAHCQPGFLASLVAVFGEFDISGDLESKRAVTKNVKRVIVHRQYDAATFENDIALLELDSPVTFDTHVVPICMPLDTADFTGRMATVTGWGRLKYGGGVPSVLQEVQVPIIENSVCQEMFHTAGHNKKILNSFLCAGYANGQKDSCEGDSGGPLVLQRADGRYELAGTVSHGIKCAAPYLPGVYMRTTFYKPWLRSITGVK